MRRILEIINLASSAENFIGDQMSFFQTIGDYELHLICSDGPRLKDFCKEQNVKCKVVPLNRQLTPIQDIKAFIAISKYIRKNKIDIIFCHQAKARTIAIPASFLMRVKHRIIFSHGVLHETMHGFKRFLVLFNDRLLSRMATGVICVSHHVAQKRVADKIDKASKQVIIGHGSCSGIDVENKFNPALIDKQKLLAIKKSLGLLPDDFVVGFCGRLVRDKGVAELADGFRLLCYNYPDRNLKLLIVGNPETRDALRVETVELLKNDNNVIFTGAVPSERMPYYYSIMNVFILPSHRDGLGMVSLEAQAMGIPAIVSSITGCRETIKDGITGKYCDLNADSIANTIEFFFDSEKSSQMGEAGREFIVNSFNHTRFKQQMLDFINSLD